MSQRRKGHVGQASSASINHDHREPVVIDQATGEQEDGFLYRVAVLAWKDGLAANAIAHRLGGPHLIMKVKRALAKAVRCGILRFEPPPMVAATKELLSNPQWKAREYTVVDDSPSSDGNPVYVKGAELLRDLIVRRLDATRTSGT